MSVKPIDLDAIIAQREEATGIEDGRVPFTFKGETYTFRDPNLVSDEELGELVDVDFGPDLCVFYMGEEEYLRFVDAGGNSNIWALALNAYVEKVQDHTSKGKGRFSSSVKRTAGRKR